MLYVETDWSMFLRNVMTEIQLIMTVVIHRVKFRFIINAVSMMRIFHKASVFQLVQTDTKFPPKLAMTVISSQAMDAVRLALLK